MMTKAKTTPIPNAAKKTLNAKPDVPAASKSPRKPAKSFGATPTPQLTVADRAAITAMPFASAPATSHPRQTKSALLRARLADPGGVSIGALMTATGWQAHTLRAALSGLRKAGVILTRRREGEDTIYAIDADRQATTCAAGDATGEGANPAAILPVAGTPADDAATENGRMIGADA